MNKCTSHLFTKLESRLKLLWGVCVCVTLAADKARTAAITPMSFLGELLGGLPVDQAPLKRAQAYRSFFC